MGETANVASEIRSICHDALTAEHERDYQALGQFLLPSIWKYLACEVVVVEIRSKVGAVFHTYPAFPVENESLIFLIAHQGHMMWGNLQHRLRARLGEIGELTRPSPEAR